MTRTIERSISDPVDEARRLTDIIGGVLLVTFAPDTCNSEEDHHPDGNPSRGHLWAVQKAWLEDETADPILFHLDDRKGPIAHLLAEKLRADARHWNLLARHIERSLPATIGGGV